MLIHIGHLQTSQSVNLSVSYTKLFKVYNADESGYIIIILLNNLVDYEYRWFLKYFVNVGEGSATHDA